MIPYRLTLNIQPAKVFHLAGRILEEKTSLPFLTMAQATTEDSAILDVEDVAKRQARLAAEAITSFDAHTSGDGGPSTSYDLPVAAEATYLSDVAARPTRECRGIRLGVVHMVNDTDILVISRTRGNTI